MIRIYFMKKILPQNLLLIELLKLMLFYIQSGMYILSVFQFIVIYLSIFFFKNNYSTGVNDIVTCFQDIVNSFGFATRIFRTEIELKELYTPSDSDRLKPLAKPTISTALLQATYRYVSKYILYNCM